ncbi:MAG: preprotein translocase subunit YajC [Pirellulales bacterium]
MCWPSITHSMLLAQEGGGGGGPGGFGMLPLFAILGLLFYFMVIAPERRRQKEHQALIENLKRNDRVVTIGGIKGVVLNVNKDTKEVTVRIDEATNTKIHCDVTAIARVETDAVGGEKTSKSSEGSK